MSRISISLVFSSFSVPDKKGCPMTVMEDVSETRFTNRIIASTTPTSMATVKSTIRTIEARTGASRGSLW